MHKLLNVALKLTTVKMDLLVAKLFKRKKILHFEETPI